jgi:alkanesulfonate monooxygenase SsuD/methylene tetrahydromethanopterin reductase-like flavin-dependent oxidoreductase (luciferase family)
MARTPEGVGFDSLWFGDHLLYEPPGGLTRGPWEYGYE